jgi:hypothetical protein
VPLLLHAPVPEFVKATGSPLEAVAATVKLAP